VDWWTAEDSKRHWQRHLLINTVLEPLPGTFVDGNLP
jgi:hypothetical protein